MKTLLTPEEGKEYQRLLKAHAEATLVAGAILARYGMSSPEFREADAKTCDLWVRMRRILGEENEHWAS